MIQIVRTIRMDNLRPAGVVFSLDDEMEKEISEALNFLWGRDCNYYLLFCNGDSINILSSELGEIEKRLRFHYNKDEL